MWSLPQLLRPEHIKSHLDLLSTVSAFIDFIWQPCTRRVLTLKTFRFSEGSEMKVDLSCCSFQVKTSQIIDKRKK